MELRGQLVCPGDLLHGLPELQQRGLPAAGDVVDVVHPVRFHRQEVGPGDVLDEDEIHGGGAVAVDLGRNAAVDAVEPANEDLGVGPGDIHARAVDVEVTQSHAGQAVHVVEATGDPFVHQLGGTVDRAVVVGMMPLVGGKLVGSAVDRRRGCVDHLLDTGLDRRLEHVERSAHKDIDAFSRAFGAERDPDGGLVKHVVAAGNNLHDRFAISHVALHEDDGQVGPRRREGSPGGPG